MQMRCIEAVNRKSRVSLFLTRFGPVCTRQLLATLLNPEDKLERRNERLPVAESETLASTK